MKADESESSKLTLRVGVTGHRSHRLQQMDEPLLRQRIHDVLDWLVEHRASRPALSVLGLAGSFESVTVLSPLAEGADQLVAEEALRLGCPLWSALPFTRDEYASDFVMPGGRDVFRMLLARAEQVDELAGSRATRASEEAAYANVGHFVLARSDVLLAIWDGEAAQGLGGTAAIVGSALRRGLRVIWIDADQPHAIQVLNQPDGSEHIEVLDWFSAERSMRPTPD